MPSKVKFEFGEGEIVAMMQNGENDQYDGNIERGLVMQPGDDVEVSVQSSGEEEDQGSGYDDDRVSLGGYKNSEWYLFGAAVPKTEVIFICQVVVLYIVILTCIVNLSLKNGDSNLWTALLSSSLGIMLPQPTLTSKKKQ